jgi:hypothetical protein
VICSSSQTTFEREQQKLKPYGVVWVNSDPLDLSGS